jgi:protein arginine N-methyltransferase 1
VLAYVLLGGVSMKSALANWRPKVHSRRSKEVSPIHRVDEESQLGQFIPLHYHGQMLMNEQRMVPFEEAISRLVPVNANVVELGGGTGVLSFFASKRARKVTLVEKLPHVAAAARRLLHANGVADKVCVVEADARMYVPDEPADVVICEMLHVGLLREKQIEVLQHFKAQHEAKFGLRVPLILPEAAILAVQPVFQPYDFHGFCATVPLFFDAFALSNTVEMGPPALYSTIEFVADLPESFTFEQPTLIDRTGTVNALRFVTKVPVGIFADELRSADWYMPYMSLPLATPIEVEAGTEIKLSFQYDAGGSIESLQSSIQVTRCE